MLIFKVTWISNILQKTIDAVVVYLRKLTRDTTSVAAASNEELVERVKEEIRNQRGEELPHFLPYRACQVVVSGLLKASVRKIIHIDKLTM